MPGFALKDRIVPDFLKLSLNASGLLDRSWVAGVTATEVMLAHVVSQFVVMVVQV